MTAKDALDSHLLTARYGGCSLVATGGEARMELFPNYFFGNQNTADVLRGRGGGGVPSNKFLDQLESDTSLTRQDLDLHVMTNRWKWNRLIKSVRVRPK